MKNLLINRFCWICIFLCAPYLTDAQQVSTSYADSLYKAGNYRFASLEYERVVFLSPGPAQECEAVLRKADCLKHMGEYEEAQQYLEQHFIEGVVDSLQHALLYQTVLDAYLGGHFKDAYIKTLDLINKDSLLRFDKDVLLLQILSLNELRQWHEADSIYHIWAKLVVGNNQDSMAYARMPRLKDPEKAGKLGMYLPLTGAGLFYAGDVGEGILSALIQIGFIGFGGYCFINQLYFTGIFVGVGGYASFYKGGARRAEIVAENRNARKASAFNEKIKNILLKQYNELSNK